VKATAVLPVKRFGAAKRRLATGIDDARREALVDAMLEDVLEAIGEARTIERTIVVSDEPRAAEELGAECVVLLPGDCPLLEPRELDRLLTGVPASYVAIVPDRHRTGTNALVLAPPNAIPPAFGEGSCARHVAAAREAGVPYGVEEVASLALDLDTPADVVAITRELEDGANRARRTARALGL
jgi:2-phospho-L-lactate guanylyltransferase